jgi:protein TonB
VILGALIVVPLVATGAFPTPQAVLTFVTPPPAPAPPRTPPPERINPRPAPDPTVNPDAAPLEASDRPAVEPPPRLDYQLVPIPDVGTGTAVPFASVPPPAPKADLPDAPIRPGGDIREPRKVFDVTPVYPAIARAARVEGTVIIEATIARDGSVRDARLLRSTPMLDQAALDAVRQWRYTPSLLNGTPVEVLVTVTVRFTVR